MDRRPVVRLVALLLVAASALLAQARAAACRPVPLERVRTADRGVAGMMEDASRRSPTFRRLVAELQSSDLIVYVDVSPHLPDADRGGLKFVCSRGIHRYLRVSVRPRLGPREFLATVAHELQHALEIAAHGEVVDGPSMAALYDRIGRRSPNGFETEAAVRMSHLVCDEFDTGQADAASLTRHPPLHPGAIRPAGSPR